MVILPYDADRLIRNADFISIAPKGETTHYILRVASAPSKCVRCAPQGGNPLPSAPQALLPPERSDTQPAAGRRPQPSGRSPVNPHTEGVSKGASRAFVPQQNRAANTARFYYAQISFVSLTSSMVFVPASCMVMASSLLKWSNTDFTPSAPPRLRP